MSYMNQEGNDTEESAYVLSVREVKLTDKGLMIRTYSQGWYRIERADVKDIVNVISDYRP